MYILYIYFHFHFHFVYYIYFLFFFLFSIYTFSLKRQIIYSKFTILYIFSDTFFLKNENSYNAYYHEFSTFCHSTKVNSRSRISPHLWHFSYHPVEINGHVFSGLYPTLPGPTGRCAGTYSFFSLFRKKIVMVPPFYQRTAIGPLVNAPFLQYSCKTLSVPAQRRVGSARHQLILFLQFNLFKEYWYLVLTQCQEI